MRSIQSRKRTADDDIKSIQRVSNIGVTEATVTVPETPSTPIVVWEQSKISDNSVDNLKDHLRWPLSCDKRCHNCAHYFEGVPVPLPVSRDELRQIYFCEGKFCSWQCAKSFNMRETSPAGKGNRNMYISLLAYKTWIKLKHPPALDDVCREKMRTYCNYRIDPAPPRANLVEFGGTVTIEEYRKNFCGVVPPSEIIEKTDPKLNLRLMAILPFIDTDADGSAPRVTKKSVQLIEPTRFSSGTKRIETNRVQEFNNSFVDRLKRAKVDPAIMRRKKEPEFSNTLLSSMGIEIKKRSK